MKSLPFRAFALLAEPAKVFDELVEQRNTLQPITFLLFVNFGCILSFLLLHPQGTGRSVFLLFFGTGCSMLMMLGVLALFTSLIHFSAEMLGNSGRVFTTFSMLCASMFPLFLVTPMSIVSRYFGLSYFSLLAPFVLCLKIWVFVLTILAIRSSYQTRTAEALIIFFIPILIIGVIAATLFVGGVVMFSSLLHSVLDHFVMY